MEVMKEVMHRSHYGVFCSSIDIHTRRRERYGAK
jgi:hypothetical protein